MPRTNSIPLKRVQIHGFKSFRDASQADFRPLTILAGANSSGKSSLMQPLLLLKQTFDAPYDPGPVMLDGPNIAFSDVQQLFWYAAGKQRRRRFTLRLTASQQTSVAITFKRVPGRHKAQPESLDITACTWKHNGREARLSPDMHGKAVWDVASAILREYSPEAQVIGEQKLVDRLRVLRSRAFLVIGFEGAFILPGPWHVIESLVRNLIHVPGLRGNPRRTYPQTAVGDTFPGVFHTYVASVIVHWQKEKPDRLSELGDALRHLGLTWKVEARQVSATKVELKVGRLREGKRGGARDTVNIADVGFGLSQVLPVVVSLLAARPGQIVYLEQPEIHLHPRAQVALADLLVDAVKRGVQVIVETHSELLLLGVQTAVARQQLSPGSVRLHWFERDDEGATRITSAELDERGAFGEWPVDFADVAMKAMQAYLDAEAPPTRQMTLKEAKGT